MKAAAVSRSSRPLTRYHAVLLLQLLISASVLFTPVTALPSQSPASPSSHPPSPSSSPFTSVSGLIPSVCSDVDCGESLTTRNARLRRQSAAAPIRGWNSYDAFTWTVNETALVAHIDYVSTQLSSSGFSLIAVDYYWYISMDFSTTYIDSCSRVQPDPQRFPSSGKGDGFRSLAAYAHHRGLLFGIHVMRGINEQAISRKSPVCLPSGEPSNFTADEVFLPDWECNFSFENSRFYSVNLSHPGGQMYLDSLYKLYADWGVDFVKQDCVLDGDWDLQSILGSSRAIDRSGRHMLLSLSGGGSDDLYHSQQVANISYMYRVTGDVWDRWTDSVLSHFSTASQLVGFNPHSEGEWGIPSWADLDMLPFGFISEDGSSVGPFRYSNLTRDETVTAMTLWLMFRSPLIFGGDMRRMDNWTFSVLTNDEALAISDASTHNADVITSSSLAVWRADSQQYETDGISWVSISNLMDSQQRVELSVLNARAPYQQGSQCSVRDVWGREDVGFLSRLDVLLPAHGSVLYRLYSCQEEVEGEATVMQDIQ